MLGRVIEFVKKFLARERLYVIHVKMSYISLMSQGVLSVENH